MIKYKTPEVQREFENPAQCDPRLYGMICALDRFVVRTMNKDILLTDVARYEGRLDSPHRIHEGNPLSRAVDIRLKDEYFSESEILIIQHWLRDNFPRTDMAQYEKGGSTPIEGWIGVSRVHGEGDHKHLHATVEWRHRLWKAVAYTQLNVEAIQFDG
jgi:hypothetical protein